MQKTVRGKYESGFSKKDSAFNTWKRAYETAMAQPLSIELPFVFSMQIRQTSASALIYKTALKGGEMLIAELQKPSDSSTIFLELFSLLATSSGTDAPLAELKEKEHRVSWVAATNDSVLISLQPPIGDSGIYHIRIYTQPAYLFPVAGKGNSAIQSYWGAARDGGGRSHEGIDIFASRGTPVVAVADGSIGFTGEKGLGGKQVWLRENVADYSVYYAHLDSIKTSNGSSVKKGDTLGFVGNTGNAAGGAPHLHFGVYGRGGAVNPLHFVRQQDIPDYKKFSINDSVIQRSGNTVLRSGPGSKYSTIIQLQKNESLKVQARSGNWLHVLANDSLAGFVQKSGI
ncbi:M23 family metallopeptidase [Niabella ginsengisoli]|uniref:M23 family metallopeptidase n=1 Tax=Niabella ginsengisoli TaxID=522298 RepID=A0ABS9SPI7_9BACT|nr:M23 family metallopeptidase [Niabella ginsengisoli]MCH5600286.1 M23 family metallopeptidase [Niabella ginsengisoli]